jgi:hypothetical protein
MDLEVDGLVGVLDLTSNDKTVKLIDVQFNNSGDALLISDSRNKITHL